MMDASQKIQYFWAYCKFMYPCITQGLGAPRPPMYIKSGLNEQQKPVVNRWLGSRGPRVLKLAYQYCHLKMPNLILQ